MDDLRVQWSDSVVTRSFCRLVRRLVFSQSLISLDLIEDFLELSCRAKDEDKVSPYKGTFGVTTSKFSHKNIKLNPALY